jgi:hypothetical protein
MRYVKKQSLYTNSPMNDKFSVLQDERIVNNSSASMEVPLGGTADRPSVLINGTIRYNIDLREFEVYNSLNPESPGWERLRTVRPAPIVAQHLGYGTYNDNIFGPLSYDVDLSRPQNVFVFVDNVYQIPTTNYSLILNPNASTSTTAVSTSSGVTTLYLNTLTNIDAGSGNGSWRTVSGPAGIQAGTTVTSITTAWNNTFYGWPVEISLPTTNTISSGTVISFGYSAGTYIEFTGPVPFKPVFALLGFDGYWPES